MRFIFLITLISTYLLALISSPIHSTVLSVDLENQTITMKTTDKALVGMNGAVEHWFDKKHSVALSWIEVTKIEGDVTTLKLRPILALEQSALPSGTWKVQEGDNIIIGYNYQRSLLIAPNRTVYKKVTSYHNDRSWVHPDIFASVLSYSGHPSPLKEDFTYMCRINNIGTVAFMFDKSIITIDCQSFKILKNKSTSIKSAEQQAPFYSRVPNIESNWFGDGNDEIEDYDRYYVDLLAENNPKNSWMQKYKHNRDAAMGNDDSWFSSIFESFSFSFGSDDADED